MFQNDDELWKWVSDNCGLRVPRVAVCPHHQAPFEYLHHAYFEPSRDLVVWAPRGGGKTRLAAVATLLDLIHKPGCHVRILGGSLEQSRRMWEHLRADLENVEEAKALLPEKRQRDGIIRLTNGSVAAILPQSERAVRGLRLQKLRCDEAEMFQPHIWEAAQLVTRSINTVDTHTGGDLPVTGTVEAISTFHKPGGMMERIIEAAAASPDTTLLHWCLLDVLERCPAERNCETCPLFEDCNRVAKGCDGFFKIDDAIRLKQRVSREAWNSEMLCRRPMTRGSVFPSFDESVHVLKALPAHVTSASPDRISLAIDFGFHNPFVCLWVVDDGKRCWVIDEYVQEQRTVAQHLEQIESRPWGNVRRICCDPAGAGRNDQTAESNVQFLRRQGYRVHTRHSRIVEGLELIRAALRPASGPVTLFIHEDCKRLIAAMKALQYPKTGGELPLKDGTHDHLTDALRYFHVNRRTGEPQPPRSY